MTVSLVEKQIDDFNRMAQSRTWSRRDARLEKMERLYAGINRGSKLGIVLCFALAKVYDDLGEIDKAFALLQEGNRLHRQGKGDSIADAHKTIAAVKRVFDRPVRYLQESNPLQPIFIVGLPRSGTTLVEQILSSHSEVEGGGELSLMGRWCVPFLNSFIRDPATVLDEHLPGLREFYETGIRELGLGSRVTDKMPQNFLWTGFILSAFPLARVVHTVRDPMAVCWSLFKTSFAGSHHGYACDLSDIGEFHRLYRDLMVYWHEKFPGRIYDLCYEDLTEQQELQTRQLLEYCGLSWQPACLEFYLNPRKVVTASAQQVTKPMYQGSSSAWKRYEKYLEPLKQALQLSAQGA